MNNSQNASPRQTFALFCATGKDFRPLNLSRDLASALLSALQPYRGNKATALEVANKMLAGETVQITSTIGQDEKFAELFSRANQAGQEAAEKTTPTPMIVGTPTHPLGNDIDPNQKVHYVWQGVCGFASVIIRPGNCSFANWLKKTHRVYKHYYGGISYPIDEYGQSYEMKVAHAGAMAGILQKEGIRASCDSRLD